MRDGRVPRRLHDRSTSPRWSIARAPRTRTWRPASRSASASSPRRSCGSATPTRCTSATTHRADGRWRIYAFADGAAPGERRPRSPTGPPGSPTSPESPLARARPPGADVDAWFDVKVDLPAGPRRASTSAPCPTVFLPAGRPVRAHRLREGLRDATRTTDIFELRGIDRGGVRRRGAPGPVRRERAAADRDGRARRVLRAPPAGRQPRP